MAHGADQLIDYGLPLDRARAGVHAVAGALAAGFLDPGWPAWAIVALVFVQIGFVLAAMWCLAAADDHRAHAVKAAATIPWAATVAAAAWHPVVAVLLVVVTVDALTYFATATRRIAFFDARKADL